MNERQEELAEERLARFEAAVADLDRAATKLCSAAESMCEAANRQAKAADEFGTHVANLEATQRKARQYV